MKEKHLIITARALSLVFTPFYLPLVGIAALFAFSYLSQAPLRYKVTVLALAYTFTILLPSLAIHYWRKANGWHSTEISRKERRVIPYLISILCYFLGCYTMGALHIPWLIISIVLTALAIQTVCATVNVWWKISTHTAAIGGVGGALVAFSRLFLFDPMGWLTVVILVAGMVGTARMILRQHTLSQIVGGFLVGFAAGLLEFFI